MNEHDHSACTRLNGKGDSFGAIVLRKCGDTTEVLMLSHGSRGWVFPKNRQAEGESEEDTARREVRNAAGIALRFVPGFRFEGSSAFRNEQRNMVYFLAEPVSDTLTVPDPDHSMPAWQKTEDAEALLRFPEDLPPFRAALDYFQQHR